MKSNIEKEKPKWVLSRSQLNQLKRNLLESDRKLPPSPPETSASSLSGTESSVDTCMDELLDVAEDYNGFIKTFPQVYNHESLLSRMFNAQHKTMPQLYEAEYLSQNIKGSHLTHPSWNLSNTARARSQSEPVECIMSLSDDHCRMIW